MRVAFCGLGGSANIEYNNFDAAQLDPHLGPLPQVEEVFLESIGFKPLPVVGIRQFLGLPSPMINLSASTAT
jgi:hypothetical protein